MKKVLITAVEIGPFLWDFHRNPYNEGVTGERLAAYLNEKYDIKIKRHKCPTRYTCGECFKKFKLIKIK